MALNFLQSVNLIDGSVNYIDPLSDEAKSIKLAQHEVPEEHETWENKTKEELKASIPLTADLSVRNYRQAYVIPTDRDRVLLNLIPEKTFITDSSMNNIIDNQFQYFIPGADDPVPPNPFSLVDGTFFRCAGQGVSAIENYQYYQMQRGSAVAIPNFKTLQVMLVERNLTYAAVRVIEKNQCEELMGSTPPAAPTPSRENEYTEDMADQVSFDTYVDLKREAESASAVAAAAAAEADKNIKAIKAEKDAEKAKAEQAKAEAEAAKKEAEAAKAASEAAKAEAAAASAQAKAAEAQAKAKEAEFNAQLGT